MNQIQINNPSLADAIRQEYFDVIHPNESISNLIFDYKGKVENFLQKICNILNAKLQADILNEIVYDTSSIFSIYPKYSLPHLSVFLQSCKSSSNFIIVTASIISELIMAKHNVNDVMINSFVDESLNAILLQIQKNTIEISLFGHSIPQQFKNTLIINLLISSKLTNKLCSFFLCHVLPAYLFSNDKKIHFLLQKMIDSSLVDISIEGHQVSRELSQMISSKDIDCTSNLNEKTLSFLSCVMFFAKNRWEKDIKGLDTKTVLPFLAFMTIYLRSDRIFSNFSNKKFQTMILSGIELLANNSSDLLKASIDLILLFLDFIWQNQVISYDQYTKIISILAEKFFKKQFTYDINLVLPYLFKNSFYYYSIFNKYGMDLIDVLVKNCSNIGYLKTRKLNMSIFREEKMIRYLMNLNSLNESKTIMQSFHFLNCCCNFTPITDFSKRISFLEKFLNEKINQKCWDDVILIGNFIKKNDCRIKQNSDKSYPNHVLNIIFDKDIQKLNIDELLSCILNETSIKKTNLYIDMLLKEMMQDPYTRCGYLGYLIYINSGDYIHCSTLLHKLSEQYEKYKEDFVDAAQRQFYLHKEYNILYTKENYKLHHVSFPPIEDRIITEIFRKINSKPVNNQEFICLFNIARAFPFLFYHNPQQAFKSVLPAFDYISLIYSDLENSNRDTFIKNTISAMSFLFTIMQFPYILDNFLQWFLPNITIYSNSQIFGFILLLSFFAQGNESKIVLGYILKYKFLEKIEIILKKEHQDSEFKRKFMLAINSFITNVFQIMMNTSKYEIIHIEELMKKDYPISYMNAPSLKYNNLHFFITIIKKYLTDNDQFLEFLGHRNEFCLSYTCNKSIDLPSFDRIKDFVEKMKRNSEEFNIVKNAPQFHDFYTIKMIRYLVMKPQFVYNWFLYGQNVLIKKEHVRMINHTYNVLKKMHKDAQKDKSNSENADCEQLNMIDYFKPQLNTLFKLVIFLSSHQKNDEILEILLHKITENCEFSICFTDYLFKYFVKLSTNKEEINLDSMHEIIDLFKYLLTMDEYKNEIRDFLKCNLINLALSPKWRSDLNLLQKVLEVLINYNSEFPDRIVILIKLILIENNGKLGSIINIYHKLNQEQKEKLHGTILKIFDKILFKNDVKTVIDYCDKLPILIEDKLKSFTRFLNKNASYFRNKDNLDKNAIKFLFSSFDLLALHYATKNNNDETELSHDFFNIYDKYNDLFNKIIKNHPWKIKEYNFLNNNPGLISFNVRFNIFNEMADDLKTDDEIEFDIDRNNILESSYLALNGIEPEILLKNIRIQYNNERGLDLGGPLRDWFTNISLEIFNPNFALFSCYGQDKKYQPNKQSFVNEDHLAFFDFAGKIVARALIERVPINVNFTTSFWKQILNYEPNLNDLKEIDLELYNSLQSLINNDVDSLCLSFTSDEDEFGSYLSIPLKENGSKIDVTNENKNEYIRLLSNYVLKDSIQDQVNAFCEGFYSLLLLSEIRIFTPNELNMLIGGTISIDVNDLKNNVEYELPYTADTHVVKLFFDVISKWNNVINIV